MCRKCCHPFIKGVPHPHSHPGRAGTAQLRPMPRSPRSPIPSPLPSRRQARLSPSPSHRGVDPDRPVRCRQGRRSRPTVSPRSSKVSGLTVDALTTRPASTSATLPPGPETRRCHDPDVRWSHTREPGRHQGHRRWGDRERAESEPTPKYAGRWIPSFGPIRRKGSI